MAEEAQDPTTGNPSTPKLPFDHWPPSSGGNDRFDEAADDTFTDEVTIPFKPRRAAHRSEVADWPPRSPPLARSDDPTDGSEAETVNAISTARTSLDARRQTSRRRSQAVVVTIDRPPPVARPWVPRRDRLLDVNSIVRHRGSWRVWLPVVLLVTIAVVVGAAVFLLTTPNT